MPDLVAKETFKETRERERAEQAEFEKKERVRALTHWLSNTCPSCGCGLTHAYGIGYFCERCDR